MAIRMKEWGMLAPAATGVDRSGQKRAILGHVEVVQERARSINHLAEGMGSLIEGEGQRAQQREREQEEDLLNQVQSTGELSDLMTRLEEASQLTAEEMQDLPTGQDLNYAWKQRATPHYKAALETLSPASREAGAQLAEMMSKRAYIQTKQQLKLSRINTARNQWNESLQRSIDQGNEQDASRWIDSAVDIFIPRSSVEAAKQTAQSAARSRQWMDRFNTAPIQTLAEYQQAGSDQLPQSTEHRDALSTLYQETRLGAKSALVNNLSRHILANQALTRDSLQPSLDAGLITEAQAEQMTSRARLLPSQHTPLTYCQWQERVDRCPSEEGELLDIKLSIASAPLMQAEKKNLLLRLEANNQLPESKRHSMSHSIWSAYKRGDFGTPGDALSIARLRQLQDMVPSLLREENQAKLDKLIDEYRLPEASWVCFSDQSDQNEQTSATSPSVTS